MQRYAHGVSDATWLHRQQKVHTARGESAAVQHSAMPCLTPTLPHWDYQNSSLQQRLTDRTAVYGPVRTVVWEGWNREAPPYPDSTRAEPEKRKATLGN
jgi:hypothetical protein